MRGRFCDYYIEFPIIFKLVELFIKHVYFSMFERKPKEEKEKRDGAKRRRKKQ